MSFNNISFILHKPQLSENIGACARGMKNFNFKKLVVIDPKPIFPNDKILATSVGAKNIINKAKNYESLENCLKNIKGKLDDGSNEFIDYQQSPQFKNFETKKKAPKRGLLL